MTKEQGGEHLALLFVRIATKETDRRGRRSLQNVQNKKGEARCTSSFSFSVTQKYAVRGHADF